MNLSLDAKLAFPTINDINKEAPSALLTHKSYRRRTVREKTCVLLGTRGYHTNCWYVARLQVRHSERLGDPTDTSRISYRTRGKSPGHLLQCLVCNKKNIEHTMGMMYSEIILYVLPKHELPSLYSYLYRSGRVPRISRAFMSLTRLLSRPKTCKLL